MRDSIDSAIVHCAVDGDAIQGEADHAYGHVGWMCGKREMQQEPWQLCVGGPNHNERRDPTVKSETSRSDDRKDCSPR